MRRWLQRLRSEEMALVHRLHGCRSNRKLAEALQGRCLRRLRQARYAGFGPTLAAEHLRQHELQVSRETLRRWMNAAGLWRVRRHKRKALEQILSVRVTHLSQDFRPLTNRVAFLGNFATNPGPNLLWNGKERLDDNRIELLP